MSSNPNTASAPTPKAAIIISAMIVAVGALGFVGWSNEGTNLFFSLIQAGLAWCL
ncbi:MAG: hypothetical protein AAFY99_12095 [Pseudomonadota bacterium]